MNANRSSVAVTRRVDRAVSPEYLTRAESLAMPGVMVRPLAYSPISKMQQSEHRILAIRFNHFRHRRRPSLIETARTSCLALVAPRLEQSDLTKSTLNRTEVVLENVRAVDTHIKGQD